MAEDSDTTDAASQTQWKPIKRVERRVLGVLVEKAKTTPDQYPLSLNGLTSGCNQKSNRSPKMDLDSDDVEEALEALRVAGATAEVHGDGRVVRYRHYMKDWLGVDGVELAVMAELLLRGTQTVGELRGRAARMASGQLGDMQALRPVLASLIEKNLVVPLTPAGRGQVVTHALYQPEELAHERKKVGKAGNGLGTTSPSPTVVLSPNTAPGAPSQEKNVHGSNRAPSEAESTPEYPGDLHAEVTRLRTEVARLRKEVEDLWENLGR